MRRSPVTASAASSSASRRAPGVFDRPSRPRQSSTTVSIAPPTITSVAPPAATPDVCTGPGSQLRGPARSLPPARRAATSAPSGFSGFSAQAQLGAGWAYRALCVRRAAHDLIEATRARPTRRTRRGSPPNWGHATSTTVRADGCSRAELRHRRGRCCDGADRHAATAPRARAHDRPPDRTSAFARPSPTRGATRGRAVVATTPGHGPHFPARC